MSDEERELTPEEKLAEYEQLLDRLLDQQGMVEGRIIAGPTDGLFKVHTEKGEVIVKEPTEIKVSTNDRIIVCGNAIYRKLPEELAVVEEEEIEFEHVKWDEIGGIRSQIKRIRETVEYPIKYKDIYEEFNLKPSKGILLFGPPGCGKTMIAKAIASNILEGKKITKHSFIYLKGGELLSKYVGETENRIKSIFDSARRTYIKTGERPVVFIDEAEAILPPRGSRHSSDVETTIVPTFLSEMDGFEGHNPFIILATNFKEKIDSAVQRPGRIDLKVYIGRPDINDSIEIFEIYLKKTKVADDVSTLARIGAEHLFSIDKLESEISGAFIDNIVSTATERALLKRIKGEVKKAGITKEDLINAINSY